MSRGQVGGHSSIFNFLVGVLVFGRRWYLLDLVLCSSGCVALLRVVQSGLWDGLRGCNGLVAFND